MGDGVSNASDPAFPETDYVNLIKEHGGYVTMTHTGGLTKREWLAGEIMGGFAAAGKSLLNARDFAARSVEWADALLAELAKDAE